MVDRVEVVVKRLLAQAKGEVDAALGRLLPPPTTHPFRVHEAMRYAVLTGGKRVRPALCLMCAEALDGRGAREDALPAAAALECIHAYSLVHDDLPAMDDDDFRRGNPTAHKQFDEATAILAGDGLLTYAFWIIARAYRGAPELAVALTAELAGAAGSEGMVGGQVIDMGSHDLPQSEEALSDLHLRKTGALIRASIISGALVAGGWHGEIRRALEVYAAAVGLAFQVADDILDVTRSREELGKTPGKDEEQGDFTYISLLGLDGARRRADELRERAVAAIEPLMPGAESLAYLAHFIVDRAF